MFRWFRGIIKKHEGKLIGAFMISTWGASAALVVKTALEADYSVLAKKSGPTKTTTSPGPTIQGFDLPPVTTTEPAERTSAEKKEEEKKGGGSADA